MAITTVKKASRLFERELKNRFDGDLNREIAELITNSIDSYNRLIKKGLLSETAARCVKVKLCKAQRKSVEKNTIQVIDNAEGMTKDTMLRIFGEKGADNNQGGDNDKIRGLFGLGASDCMGASAAEGKSAEYWSFKDGEITNLRFNLSKQGTDIEIVDTSIKDPSQIANLRAKYGINDNGTVAIFGIPDSVVLDKDVASFKHSLETIFLLRNLLADDLNVVTLECYGETVRLSSKEYSLSNPFLVKDNIHFTFKDKVFNGKIEFFKNENKEANPTHILVQDDRGNLYDNQMFGFAKAQGNEHLSGVLTLYGFWDLLNYFLNLRIETIKDDRTGFDISKKFGKLLSDSISKAISEALSILLKEEGNTNISLSKTKNYHNFLKFLNKDLNSNRSSIGGSRHEKEAPADCIEFARKRASVTSGHGYDLKLYINREQLSANRIINLTTLSNEGNLEIPEMIEIKDDDLKDEIIVKSVAINALTKTIVPVVLNASYDSYSTSCEITVIEEEIVYPEHGIEFEKHEVSFTPDVNHKKIRLYFDKEIINENDTINITNDSNGRLICTNSSFSILDGTMITDNIGYINLEFNGGDLKDKYNVVASCNAINDKMLVKISASPYMVHGSTGDISDYEIDPEEIYIEQKSYYDLRDRKVKIVKGNPINDSFITNYNDKVGGKSLIYIISLVCYEAAKIYASKLKSNGHIDPTDFDSFEQTIETKQKEYFDKYLSLENDKS